MYNPIMKKLLTLVHRLKKSSFMKDSLMLGIFSGMIGSIAIESLNVFLSKGLYFGKLASSMLVNPLRSIRLKNIILGEVMHLIVGASLGYGLVAGLKKTGKDLIILKGIFVGLLAWIGLNNLGNKLNLFSVKPRSTTDHYFALLQHIFFGLTTAAVVKFFAAPVTVLQASTSLSINPPINSNN